MARIAGIPLAGASEESSAGGGSLRFSWRTDADSRFAIESPAFLAIAGPRTANLMGRFWSEISAKLALDPEGCVAHALVTRQAFEGVLVDWPLASGERAALALSGQPHFVDGDFHGYAGSAAPPGEERAEQSEPETTGDSAPSAAALAPAAAETSAEVDAAPPEIEPTPPPIEPSLEQTDQAPVAENVVPFPTLHQDTRGLTPGERTAFREIGSRLSARLKGADEVARGLVARPANEDLPIPASPVTTERAEREPLLAQTHQAEPPAGGFVFDPSTLDQLPLGVLIYRQSTPLYCNAEFLKLVGQASLADFAQAGGLDSLFIEMRTIEDGTQRLEVRPSERGDALPARLVPVTAEGEQALALVLLPIAVLDASTAPDDQTEALTAILDVAADGIVILDRDGRVLEANAGAERLFGQPSRELTGQPFQRLFGPDSERTARAEFERAATAGRTGDPAAGCDVTARQPPDPPLALHLRVGRIDQQGERYCAVFRDISRWKESEHELTAARQQAEMASSAKSDFLAKISHEMRTPLNAIIGFSEVMMGEQFGPIGNDRYRDYLKDIVASGEHLVSLLNDLLDLSKIEAGKMEFETERVNINDIARQSVALMQPQASRARVVVRTALSMNVPDLLADPRSLRQIVLNLLSNSIKFTKAGGQVIVSTALNEHGEVTLRIRDTGIGMSPKDIESALQPFRQLSTNPRSDVSGTGLGLPLTKAMVEANQGRFSIKSALNAGTLVEIVFPAARAAA